jgi:hypothetical protein
MSLKTEDKQARAEMARRRSTRCSRHNCKDCRDENCYRRPQRSRHRTPEENAIKAPAPPTLSPMSMPAAAPAPPPPTTAATRPTPSPLRLAAAKTEPSTVVAPDWAASSRPRAVAAGLLAAFRTRKHDLNGWGSRYESINAAPPTASSPAQTRAPSKAQGR